MFGLMKLCHLPNIYHSTFRIQMFIAFMECLLCNSVVEHKIGLNLFLFVIPR